MKLSHSVSGAIRTFAYFMASGTHHELKGLNYLWLYGEEPSAIEQVYAIFANVLESDEQGTVTNVKYATYRATQYLRSYLDETYQVEPAFADWEVTLY